MSSKLHVAICQPYIIKGGRLQVIIGIVRALNEMGIVPDIITFKSKVDFSEIQSSYGETVEINYRPIWGPRLPQDFAILLFHRRLRRYAGDYDLLISTSNSLMWLPETTTVLSYMFYPRKSRIMYKAVDIHLPDANPRIWTRAGIEKRLLQIIYRLAQANTSQPIICMTKFTDDALRSVYPIQRDLPFIYPAVDMSRFADDGTEKNQRMIVTLGRFAPNKRQLEQVKLAEKMPQWTFHIIGFITKESYFRQCKQYVLDHNLSNVHLHPNASFEEMIGLLRQARFFLHTLINEPFGITAVQAISAGALPIVHDSGGQRETVILPQLRYQELDDVPDMLEQLLVLPHEKLTEMIQALQTHVRENFTTDQFHRRMLELLEGLCSNI